MQVGCSRHLYSAHHGAPSRVAVVARGSTVDVEQLAAVVGGTEHGAPAVGRILIGAAVQQAAQQRLEAQVLGDVVGDRSPSAPPLRVRPLQVTLSPKTRSSASSPSAMSLPAPPIRMSRPRWPKMTSSLPRLVGRATRSRDRIERRGLDLLQQRVGQVRIGHVLDDSRRGRRRSRRRRPELGGRRRRESGPSP